MTSAIATCPRPAPGFDAASSLRRIIGVVADALSCAWSGLQSVSRAGLLEAVRERRGVRNSTGMRIRRLP
ncbi:MAG TPA: hypothetical protein VFP70_08430 [Burkholderiales bacterium]|nr:hypothetical protein [Burkholderiales bacterium]